MTESIIQVDNVGVQYRIGGPKSDSLKTQLLTAFKRTPKKSKAWALHNVSFSVQPGEMLGILGHNGAGKSTLLKVICGVLPPTAGRVQVEGRISPLLELGGAFDYESTGRENIQFYGALFNLSKSEIESREQRIIDFAELGNFIDQPVKTYSSGMMARLGFAIATEVDPAILIIDEILGVGDLRFQRKCRERMDRFRDQKVTTLLVSHSLDRMMRCDRLIWLEHGVIRHIGNPKEIIPAYKNAMLQSQSVKTAKPARSTFFRNRMQCQTVLQHLYTKTDTPNIAFLGGDIGANALSYGIEAVQQSRHLNCTVLDDAEHKAHFTKRLFTDQQLSFGGFGGLTNKERDAYFLGNEEGEYYFGLGDSPIDFDEQVSTKFEPVKLDGSTPKNLHKSFDAVIIENALFYAEPNQVPSILEQSLSLMKPKALLAVGPVPLTLFEKLTRVMGLTPVTDHLEHIHEAWLMRRDAFEKGLTWGLEPIDKTVPDWERRYCTIFQKNDKH